MGQRTTFRELSTEAKVQFIWDYYRWRILVVILLLAAIIHTVYVKTTEVIPVLNLAVIKTEAQLEGEEIDFSSFLNENGYTEPVYVYRNLTLTGDLGTSYQSMQILHTFSMAGEIDIFLWTEDTICQYFTGGITADVFDILSPEAAEKEDFSIFYAEGSSPEESYPCYIRIENNAWALENLGASECYIAFSCNPLNPEPATKFIDYLLSFTQG